ncbi:nucleotidyltransferase family protein [Paenibacillus sp. BSR1-1]|uniref:nucleotidyltransferase family protein n=1 Tax=Paenibacillus sp. BSR1-1 TaxID=3020845 RepID=UPI0025AFD0D7|nr:nucleotidyltransferase family protein [Paenibacillus sp. BSR1-1]MDN3015239.1 nucleotidyltransferase family protein [Paenibacillus sp. BSR1-1]
MDSSRLVGIYLAAGKSTRMGRSKLNLPVYETWLGSLALRAALESKLEHTITVTRKGDTLKWLAPFSNREDVSILVCDEADRGQSASLKSGVKAAAELGADGVVILLADQPFVTSALINRLVDEFSASNEYSHLSYSQNGNSKPPVLLGRKLFPSLMELEGDQGARSLIRSEKALQGKQVELNGGIYFFDIDTFEDYQALLEIWPLKGRSGDWRL